MQGSRWGYVGTEPMMFGIKLLSETICIFQYELNSSSKPVYSPHPKIRPEDSQ